jgi:polar amino acid transport system substrate-binding protein
MPVDARRSALVQRSRSRRVLAATLALALALAACALPPDAGPVPGADRVAEARALAPTGRLRAAVAVGPSGSTFRAVLDPATGRPRGVAVDLAAALGARLGVPVDIVPYGDYPALLEDARRGTWDVVFLPQDAARARVIDYGSAYYLQSYTYLVPAGSPIARVDDLDRPGVRLAVAEGSVTARDREAALRHATLVRFRTLAEIRDRLRAGEVDATGAGRETLDGLAAQIPGARVLPDAFLVEGVAIGVPKGRGPGALAAASAFVEDAKRDGTVRRALDAAGFRDAAVAPPAR